MKKNPQNSTVLLVQSLYYNFDLFVDSMEHEYFIGTRYVPLVYMGRIYVVFQDWYNVIRFSIVLLSSTTDVTYTTIVF